MLLAIFAVSCGSDQDKYVGVYEGTFTYLNDNTQGNGPVIVSKGLFSKHKLLLYGIVSLQDVGSGVFEADVQNATVTATLLSKMLGDNNFYDEDRMDVLNVHIRAEFQEPQLHMTADCKVHYKDGSRPDEVHSIEFYGTK